VIYAKGGPDAAAAKSHIIAIMAAQQHISQADAPKKFDDAQAKLTDSKNLAIQKAKNAADAGASAASTTSFAAFGVLLLGAIAAALGGSFASRRNVQAVQQLLH
jgi:phosphate/sulfate permease